MIKTMASIFCDGACSGNGTRAAYGGWAWAFWTGVAHGEPAHYGAGKLKVPHGAAATNQRAELTALLESVRFAAAHPELKITIYTDSMYSINCTSKWGPGWKRKGWKRDSGEPLQNLDIIKPLVELWKPCWHLQHVRGHQTGAGPEVHGNNWVDRAAVAAARGEPIGGRRAEPIGGRAAEPIGGRAAEPISIVKEDVFALDIPKSPVHHDIIEHVEVPVKTVPFKSHEVKQTDIRHWFK
jgi:ribonuclease HI